MPDAIFIAGYYRSGTSALAGVLQHLGVAVHNDAEANEHNPLGFFEIPELIELDVDIFAHLGIEWSDLRPLPAGWQASPGMARFLARLDEILRRRFGAETLWAIKHPHLCRLLPLYERAARQAGHAPHLINITRDPFVVADSQRRKNGLTRAHALLLWLGYLVSFEQHSRHLPRSWITYQDLLADPAAQITQIERDLGIPLARRMPDGLRQACAFPASRLNRSDISPRDGLYPPLRRAINQVWDAISSRDFTAATWDGFGQTCHELIGFLGEIGGSQAVAIAGFSRPRAAPSRLAGTTSLRPPERLDDGAKQRLLMLAAAAPGLPKLHVLIAAPPNRAHAIGVTLESLSAQWHAADEITIISVDPFETAAHPTLPALAQAGALTAMICAQLNQAAISADYVAVLNAGDTLQPDACLRFALTAARGGADMIYCDEIVEGENAAWVRQKPGWDVTRLRQAAYIGDWVWYRGETLTRLGGFNPERAGAEEFDVQLRLAEIGARVERLPEALFSRAHLSRRDNISSPVFGARARDAITGHFSRLGIAGTVRPRTHLGLFEHLRAAPDPGTSVILLCEGADMSMLDWWTNDLLASRALTGPLILAGTDSGPETAPYLTQVAEHEAALDGKVRAVRPVPGLAPAAALAQALAMVTTEYLLLIDARSRPLTPGWGQALLNRLADPGVAMAAARLLVPEGEPVRFAVRGPIIPGAETRLGAAHFADDPGPGGWLAVDQEAGAVAPAALIVRTATLTACDVPGRLAGDAFWAAICTQIRESGQRIVWTPDVSFISLPETIEASAKDFDGDAFHHPALALRGDLLAPELRTGLVRAAPFDAESLLISGPADIGYALLNAARGLRGIGAMEASWAPEPLNPADILRRAPSCWVRINPVLAAAQPYNAVFTASATPEQRAAIRGAARLFATSPALAAQLRKQAGPGQAVMLWRPALSRAIWHDVNLVTGLNTSPRILWIDEGIAPLWLPELINQTSASATWIVVENAGAQYAGATLRMKAPEDEQGWARDLCSLAPQIFLRPAHWQADADHYPALLAAAAGCACLVDDRLDVPESLGAQRLPNNFAAWQSALQSAIAALPVTLEQGTAARAAALALPAIEDCRPPWVDFGAPDMAIRSAAE
jgi:GT2 family glycosyltransferase